jgi:hypothetical protein
MSLFESASLVVTPNGTKASKLYAIKPTSGAGDLDVVRATTATRVNSAGLIESVAVNVPRLDYTDSTCPSILVEPRRTNLVLRSQEFDNGEWSTSDVTVTANTTISPSGLQDADTINAIELEQRINQAITVVANTKYTFSFYAKKGTMTTPKYSIFDLSNGAFILTQINYSSLVNASTWSRITATFTTPAGCTSIGIYPINGASTGTIFLWGAQLEAGSYATSYIPTVASAVTRNADVISKTGISSLIGQTEGTFYLDINLKNIPINNSYIFLRNAGVTNYLGLRILNGFVGFETVTGGSPQTYISYSISETGTIKVAMAYKLNDFVFYINGIQIGVDNSATVPACDILDLNFDAPPSNAFGIKTTALWKTRLTNAELAELTTL